MRIVSCAIWADHHVTSQALASKNASFVFHSPWLWITDPHGLSPWQQALTMLSRALKADSFGVFLWTTMSVLRVKMTHKRYSYRLITQCSILMFLFCFCSLQIIFPFRLFPGLAYVTTTLNYNQSFGSPSAVWWHGSPICWCHLRCQQHMGPCGVWQWDWQQQMTLASLQCPKYPKEL